MAASVLARKAPKAAAAILAACTIACCEPAPAPEFLVRGRWPPRAHFIARLGQPSQRELTTVAKLAGRKVLTHWDAEGVEQPADTFRSRLRTLPPERPIEWIVWEGRCFTRLTYRVAGVFDPKTGRLVEINGDVFLDDWYGTG